MKEQMKFYDTGARTRACIISEDESREYLLVDTPPKEGELVNWGTILVLKHELKEYQNNHIEFRVYDLSRKFVYLASSFESAVKMHEKRWEKWEEELEAEHGSDRS